MAAPLVTGQQLDALKRQLSEILAKNPKDQAANIAMALLVAEEAALRIGQAHEEFEYDISRAIERLERARARCFTPDEEEDDER
jgi:hypothetical protein